MRSSAWLLIGATIGSELAVAGGSPECTQAASCLGANGEYSGLRSCLAQFAQNFLFQVDAGGSDKVLTYFDSCNGPVDENGSGNSVVCAWSVFNAFCTGQPVDTPTIVTGPAQTTCVNAYSAYASTPDSDMVISSFATLYDEALDGNGTLASAILSLSGNCNLGPAVCTLGALNPWCAGTPH